MLKKHLILPRSLGEALSENLVKFSDCRAFSIFKTVPGCWASIDTALIFRSKSSCFKNACPNSNIGEFLLWWRSCHWGEFPLRFLGFLFAISVGEYHKILTKKIEENWNQSQAVVKKWRCLSSFNLRLKASISEVTVVQQILALFCCVSVAFF